MEKKTGKKITDKVFDGRKEGRLGTEMRPASVRVRTEERRDEVAAVLAESGWQAHIEVDPEQPEDTTDMDILLSPQHPVSVPPKVGRNEPCPCGSGKKYKKCCGA